MPDPLEVTQEMHMAAMDAWCGARPDYVVRTKAVDALINEAIEEARRV